MLKIKSFFRINNTFIPISDFFGTLPDDFYVEGAIEISQNERKILSLKHWDLVDQTWSRFVKGVENVLKGLEFRTFLPDQPLFVSFQPDIISSRVLLQVEKESIFIDYDEFITTMIEEATVFFEKMNTLMPSEYDFELERLDLLKKLYNKN